MDEMGSMGVFWVALADITPVQEHARTCVRMCMCVCVCVCVEEGVVEG